MNTSEQEDSPRDLPAEAADESNLGRLLQSAIRLQIPGYTIICGLGRGGQAQVYRAIQVSDSTEVAIKVLHPASGAKPDVAARFQREVAALKVLNHPGVVRIFGDGTTPDGKLYLVTEFVRGSTLDIFVERNLAENDIDSRLRLFKRICDGVDAAHRTGIIHRDLTPSNILVDAGGQPRIIDFGIATLLFDPALNLSAAATEPGAFVGKIDFAAPEQIQGDGHVSQQADVYSLGVILYSLLSGGRLPHNHGGSILARANRICNEPPEPLRPPAAGFGERSALVPLVMKSLARIPAMRYHNAGEFGRAVAEVEADWTTRVANASVEPNTAQPATNEPSTQDLAATTTHATTGANMDFTNSRNRQKLIDWAGKIRAVIADRGDAEGVEQIKAAIEAYRQDRFTIAVIGKAKRGKSTLLNAILGRTDDLVAPVDRLPASSAITRFGYAPSEEAEVIFRNERTLPIGFDAIREYVTEELNPENKKEVALVRVRGPFPNLDRDLELVDTPGAGSLHEHHDELLYGFIPEADAVIFLTSARMPLDTSELELLKKVQNAEISKIFFCINRVDELNERDLEDAARHNSKVLAAAGFGGVRLYRISAKRAFQNNWAASGLDALVTDMRNHLAMNKGRVLAARLVDQVLAAAHPVRSGLDEAIQSLDRTDAELQQDLASYREQRASILRKRKFGEAEFLNKWTAAVHSFSSGLPDARDAVLKAASDKIADCSIVQVGSLTKSLPGFINSQFEEEVAPLVRTFEQTSVVLCKGYSESYPMVRVNANVGRLSARSSDGMGMKAVGGAASVAAGAGLIHAGAMAVIPVATLTVATPMAGVLSQIGGTIGGWFGCGNWLANALGGLGMGTTTVAGATPLWVAMSGPVGWSLVGIGAIAIPIAWRSSKLRQKDKLLDAIEKEIKGLFRRLESDRIPALSRLGDTIVKDLALSLDREFDQVESAIAQTLKNRPTEREKSKLRELFARINQLVESAPIGTIPSQGDG